MSRLHSPAGPSSSSSPQLHSSNTRRTTQSSGSKLTAIKEEPSATVELSLGPKIADPNHPGRIIQYIMRGDEMVGMQMISREGVPEPTTDTGAAGGTTGGTGGTGGTGEETAEAEKTGFFGCC